MNFIYNNEGRNSIYICPKCHRIISIKVKQDIEIIPDDNQDLDKIEALLFHPSAMVLSCEKCDETMFRCDNEFVDRIIKLNENGFITVYCCEGHGPSIETVDISTMIPSLKISSPYITFDYSNMSKDKVELLNNALYKFASEDMIFVMEAVPYQISVHPTGLNLDYTEYDDPNKEVENARNKLFKFIDYLFQN